MNWEDQFQRWAKAEAKNPYDDRPARLVVLETRRPARNGGTLDTPEGWEWISQALRDPVRRLFVYAVFHSQAAPGHLAPVMLEMGIEEKDPSNNRLFVEPAVKAMGARRVMNRLTQVLREGTECQKGGAASAAYWVRGDMENPRYHEARVRFRDEMLRQFVTSESVYVRQRIIPMLSMQAEDYSPEVAQLIPAAIGIARSHPDSYVRHRIEIQLGGKGPFQALPS